ncbi:uncharacterized protein LAESUDRAFT_725336 [Laetiporus sulphureus 93-53]|uniref:Uncharacterized protein n=1 Tax=Laetiporus sulphureus 93-53 TaxID=1314785 RepID=A0A165EGK6_9APHY|nr:uncharacterized protein LAESUDRAFT_725336 [Laetiporus sulphureus 93-53]KZT07012.1 hypothetical protein LAESUDRAFT_725336 [Laetiporus sulphureus 93-53]
MIPPWRDRFRQLVFSFVLLPPSLTPPKCWLPLSESWSQSSSFSLLPRFYPGSFSCAEESTTTFLDMSPEETALL